MSKDTAKPQYFTDIRANGWVALLPAAVRPYILLARLERPAGIWYLLLPSLWAIVLASGHFSSETLRIILLFGFGSVIMRAAGCVINDLWDRNLDKGVERTARRPLASGAISVKQGLFFLAGSLLAGLVILLQLNSATILLGFVSMGFVVIYPLMKRVTWWPQAFLGLTFNFGALMGWSAVTGSLGWPALALYTGGIFWTLGYDTIYAHQDKEDDLLAGIKSSALFLGERSYFWVSVFYALSWILFLLAHALTAGGYMQSIYALPAFIFMIILLYRWHPEDQASSLSTFKAGRNYGLLILLYFLIT